MGGGGGRMSARQRKERKRERGSEGERKRGEARELAYIKKACPVGVNEGNG